MEWGQIGAFLTGLAGMTAAIVQWARNRADSKVGVLSARREDQAAWDARYQSILDEVQRRLVDPLTREVDRLRAEVESLRADVDVERQALREERARYRAALAHIRALTAWIAAHMPTGTPDPPRPPDRITDDLN